MPARGFGAGVFEGLTYLQQRQDALDREAEETALRNAMQRLNEREFQFKQDVDAYNRGQTEQENTFRNRELGLREQEATRRQEREQIDDATGMVKTLIPQGYTGEEMYPLTSALRRGDVNAFNEGVKGITASPLLKEKSKQTWAKLERSLQGEDLRFFRQTRDTLYNSGGITWDEANEEALIQLHSMRAMGRLSQQGIGNTMPTHPLSPQTPEGGQAGSVPVPGGGQPLGLEQLLQLGGGGATAGRDFGVNARVREQNRSRAAFTDKTRQDMAFREKYNPLRLANAALAKEGKQLDNAMKRAKAQEFQATKQYREKMREMNLASAISEEEIRKLNLDQKKKTNEWLKRVGAGSEVELRNRRDADEAANVIEQKRKNLQMELKGIESMEFAATAVMKRTYPVQTLPDGQPNTKFQEELEDRRFAKHTLATAPARKQIIEDLLNSLNTLKTNLNPFRTKGIEKTGGNGKPVDTKSPPPAHPLPKMRLGVPGGGDQRVKTKPQQAKPLTDEERKAALRKKYGL